MATKNPKARRIRWAIAGVVVVAIAASLAVASSAFRKPAEIEESKLAPVTRDDIAKSVVATGKIEPLTKVEVKSKASGIVRQIFVEYGDRVRAGQVIAELDKDELQARVREARATLLAAQAAAESSDASIERDRVDAEGPDVKFFKASLERAQKLFEQGVVAKSQVEDAEKAYQIALNRQSSAQRSVVVSTADAARSRAQVAEARAVLERAEENLRNATIVSPMDGTILSKDVEVGDAVSSILVVGSQATLVATLGNVADVYVLGKVDEADVGKVFIGQPARISVESLKSEKFEGTVTKISPLGVEKDNVTTFEVKVSISNPTGALKANMSVNAEILLEEKRGVLLVPESALVYDKERNATVELPDATAETGKRSVPVKVGISNGVKAEILEGIDEGQRVVLQ